MAKARLDLRAVDALIAAALAEDIGPGDVTTAAVTDPNLAGRAVVLSRERGVLAGMPVARRLLRTFDKRLRISDALADGAALGPGTVIARIRGPLGSLMAVERTLLNFLQYLSGIATVTRKYVEAVRGTGAELLDTRKTLPGWRGLAKYAVSVGGGRNHRMGLFDQVLIKDNHLGASGLSAAEAVKVARSKVPRGMLVEVEVETADDARAAAAAGADIVMLDNMSPAQMRKAVAAVRAVSRKTIIEASGGITLSNVAKAAGSGVDWISAGAITHSVRSLDIAMEMETP